MKQTALEKMFQYFIEQKNNGVSHWCINDLLGQLQQAKEMEKEQIIQAYETAMETDIYNEPLKIGKDYYNQTFKSE